MTTTDTGRRGAVRIGGADRVLGEEEVGRFVELAGGHRRRRARVSACWCPTAPVRLPLPAARAAPSTGLCTGGSPGSPCWSRWGRTRR